MRTIIVVAHIASGLDACHGRSGHAIGRRSHVAATKTLAWWLPRRGGARGQLWLLPSVPQSASRKIGWMKKAEGAAGDKARADDGDGV